ncbi:hypothetical protein SLEP1_g5425 [Rubroshorea leprosula]|uniref:WAT1-related protein n=1 Tax=Rubroshorea leprosula TaxID=152421 RepID=A0AAV5HXT4_9ROSI|nr:hypothetical protein SLEP1_g5425 [Rubroshorea leprosula]
MSGVGSKGELVNPDLDYALAVGLTGLLACAGANVLCQLCFNSLASQFWVLLYSTLTFASTPIFILISHYPSASIHTNDF